MENSDGTIMEQSIEADIARENELNSKLDQIWLEKAEQELGENDTVRSIKLKQFADRIAQDENVPLCRRDNAFLLRFLRAKKFDVDKAFRMIKKYIKMKRESPELFHVSPVTEMQELLKMQMQQILPNPHANGSVVFVFRIQNCDPHKWPAELVFRSNILAVEQAIRDPRTQIGGLIALLDLAGLKIAHAKFLTPTLAKRSAEVIQDSFPIRFEAIHILNEPLYFDAFLALIKPFMKEKLRKRIYTHGNELKSLHQYIPIDILPREYGGAQGLFDNTQWQEQIMSDEQYFIRLETFSS